MPDPRETEMKLELDPGEAEDLATRVLPNLGRHAGVRHLVSVYYDTAEGALRRAGLSLRLRQDDGTRVQTVKAAKAMTAGLFERAEWETPLAGEGIDMAALAETPAAAVLAAAGQPVLPLFETVIERRIWIVSAREVAIEVALDSGRVVAGGRSEPIAELELELKRGCPADLVDLLGELGDVAGLRLGVLTKSERGYRLAAGAAPAPVKAGKIDLDPGMTTASAFQTIVQACLRQFRLNEPLVVEERLPEGLHQARVAMRRLRSALSLFKPVVADAELEALRDGLRQVSRRLGEARNLDVYLARTARPAAEAGHVGAAAFAADVERRREAAYDEVVATLRAPGFPRLLLRLLAWVTAGAWLTDVDPLRRARRDQPIAAFAATVLERRRRKVRRQGRNLAALDPVARHRVRIAAKKLRYAADFFATLATTAKARRRQRAFVEALAALQEVLGELNDIQTGHELAVGLALEDAASTGAAARAFAAGERSGSGEAEALGLLPDAERAHAAFAEARPFWRRWGRPG